MTRRRLRAAAALVAAVLAIAAATTAAGARTAAGVRIAEAPVSHFPDMVFAVSLPQDRSLTTDQVEVRENGGPVRDVEVTKPGAEATGAVLVVDASDSMAGGPLREAMAAARTFAERRNPGQRLAVVTFNDEVTVLLPLTTDTAAVERALSKVPAHATGTHIHDALAQAGALLEAAGIADGSIVLISDGTDVGSTLDQDEAVERVTEAKARVFAVGLRSPQYDPDALRAIAGETGGSYSEASRAADLSAIYDELGYTLSPEYLLRYRSLAGPSAKIAVAVRVDGIPGTARAAYTTPALATAVTAEGPSLWDRIVRSPITLLVVILVVVALLGYAVFRIVYRPDELLTRRLGQFVTLPEDERARQRQQDVAATLALEDAGSSEGFVQRLESDMAIAGIDVSFRTVVILTAVGGLAIGVVVSVLLGSPLGLLALLAAPLVTRAIVSSRLRRIRRTFADQLPENLDVLSSGLRSGHSFTGALAVCVDDAAEPAKSEFRRVIADEQLGISIDEALHVTGLRMANRDIVQVALVAKLQREAGTNAADVLDQVAENVRARLELRRLIASLTAQGRMARWIVSLLPVVLFAAIYLLNREYLEPLWTEPVGVVGLVASAIMIVLGSLVIKRIVDIEV